MTAKELSEWFYDHIDGLRVRTDLLGELTDEAAVSQLREILERFTAIAALLDSLADEPVKVEERLPGRLFATVAEMMLHSACEYVVEDSSIPCRCGQPPNLDGELCTKCSCVWAIELANSLNDKLAPSQATNTEPPPA